MGPQRLARFHPFTGLLATALGTLSLTACVYVVKSVDVVDVPAANEASYTGMAKVQLHDGSLVVFDRGITVGGGQITGDGLRHMPDGERHLVSGVSLDSAVSIQTFVEKTHHGASAALSAMATLGAGAAAVVGCADPGIGGKGGGCDAPGGSVEKVGTSLVDVAYVSEGNGAPTTIKMRKDAPPPCADCGREFVAELLAITDTTIIVLRHKPVPRDAKGPPVLRACRLCVGLPGPGAAQIKAQPSEIVTVSLANVHSLTARGLGDSENPSEPRVRTRARQLSRYPAGISDDLLRQLVDRYGRTWDSRMRAPTDSAP